MTKIDVITPQQEQQLIEFREKYHLIRTSCEPMDKKRAKTAITELYRLRGKKPPIFFFCQSPWQAMAEIRLLENSPGDKMNLSHRLSKYPRLRANVRDNLGTKLNAKLNANLSINVWDRNNIGTILRNNLWTNIRDNPRMGAKVWNKLWVYLEANVQDNLKANPKANLKVNLDPNMWTNFTETTLHGQLDGYVVSFSLFPHLYIKKIHTDEEMRILRSLDDLTQSCGWWYPYENICFICDRFEALHQDGKNRLHNTAGPALAFRDGYAIYAVNGVIIPSWIIEEPEKLSPKIITSEKNTEIRRVMMQLYGWEKILSEVDAQLIDAHPDPTIGELWRWSEPDGIDMQVLRVKNGTPEPETGGDKWYSIRVPLEFNRAIDANRNSYPICRHMTDDEFLTWNQSRT